MPQSYSAKLKLYARRRKLAKALRRRGWTLERVGRTLGISKQRAAQLVK